MQWLRIAAALIFPAAGCTSFLPHGRSDLTSRFTNFEAARDALEQLVPYRSTMEDMRRLGFDWSVAANVKLIPYPEIVSRLAPNPSIPLDMLDPGIRDCIQARQACRAYEFTIGQEKHVREGGFFRDFLNFDRTTHTTGWRFQGLVVVRDDIVLFRNFGGEPQIDKTDRQRNPLGPFQSGGEAAGKMLTQ